jgi:hypothetical protein
MSPTTTKKIVWVIIGLVIFGIVGGDLYYALQP